MLNIDASGSNQICSRFGIHPNLSALKQMYGAGDLLWISNVGVLQTANTNKVNWWEQTKRSRTLTFLRIKQAEELVVDLQMFSTG